MENKNIEISVWALDDIIEMVKKYQSYNYYGSMQLNFKGGDVLNININQSLKPPRKKRQAEEEKITKE